MARQITRHTDITLTSEERNANALRALAKLIPAVGDGLDQLVFGPSEERRQKRVESTLQEILARLDALGAQPGKAEEYVNLLERTLPKIARATNEDTRERFRDLLTNAAVLPDGDGKWAEAQLAEQLLSELDAPALGILAQVARYAGPKPMALVSRPVCQIISEKDLDWASPPLGPNPIGYAWTVIEEWARRLREKRLITFSSHNSAFGGFGGVALDELGALLVDWTVSEPAA
jgi:hypothetical protein